MNEHHLSDVSTMEYPERIRPGERLASRETTVDVAPFPSLTGLILNREDYHSSTEINGAPVRMVPSVEVGMEVTTLVIKIEWAGSICKKNRVSFDKETHLKLYLCFRYIKVFVFFRSFLFLFGLFCYNNFWIWYGDTMNSRYQRVFNKDKDRKVWNPGTTFPSHCYGAVFQITRNDFIGIWYQILGEKEPPTEDHVLKYIYVLLHHLTDISIPLDSLVYLPVDKVLTVQLDQDQVEVFWRPHSMYDAILIRLISYWEPYEGLQATPEGAQFILKHPDILKLEDPGVVSNMSCMWSEINART